METALLHGHHLHHKFVEDSIFALGMLIVISYGDWGPLSSQHWSSAKIFVVGYRRQVTWKWRPKVKILKYFLTPTKATERQEDKLYIARNRKGGWNEDHTTLLGVKCQGGTECHIIAHRKMNNIALGLRLSFHPCAPEWVTSTLWIA